MGGKAAEMLLRAGSDLMRLFERAGPGDCRRLAGGAIALSGEPPADLNYLCLTANTSKHEFDEALAAVRDKHVDAFLFVEEGADAVRGWASASGLNEVGQVPFMERRAGEIGDAPNMPVRIAGADEVAAGMRLAAAAFGLDEAACIAAVPSAFVEAEGNDLWLVEDGGEPAGCGIFIRTGEHVGIYTMATPPMYQRRGIGAAILNSAMAYYQDRGVERFTLGATEMGYPLYERVGFQVVTLPHAYMVGA